MYRSTFYDLNFSPRNGRRLTHKSYPKKKIGFEALQMGIDLHTSKYGSPMLPVPLVQVCDLSKLINASLGSWAWLNNVVTNKIYIYVPINNHTYCTGLTISLHAALRNPQHLTMSWHNAMLSSIRGQTDEKQASLFNSLWYSLSIWCNEYMKLM